MAGTGKRGGLKIHDELERKQAKAKELVSNLRKRSTANFNVDELAMLLKDWLVAVQKELQRIRVW